MKTYKQPNSSNQETILSTHLGERADKFPIIIHKGQKSILESVDVIKQFPSSVAYFAIKYNDSESISIGISQSKVSSFKYSISNIEEIKFLHKNTEEIISSYEKYISARDKVIQKILNNERLFIACELLEPNGGMYSSIETKEQDIKKIIKKLFKKFLDNNPNFNKHPYNDMKFWSFNLSIIV